MFRSLDELTTALKDWIKTWNATAQPFTWTNTPDHHRPHLPLLHTHLRIGSLARRHAHQRSAVLKVRAQNRPAGERLFPLFRVRPGIRS